MADIHAVVFDLYGVLGLNGWQAFKLQHFSDRPEDWESLRGLGARVDSGHATNEELVAAVAGAAGVSEKEVRYQFEHTIPNEPLIDWIETHLRGKYKVGLLSNASRDILHTIFTPKQRAIFDEVVTSYHVNLVKPDPRIFTLMCEKLEVLPAECVIVDDQARHLVVAAELGIQTVQYVSLTQTIREIEELCARD